MKTLTKITLTVFLLWTMVCGLRTANAAVPHLINYQGRLTDSSGVLLNGSYAIIFRLYDSETAGNLLWQETHQGVVISKGIFSLMLGSITSLNLPFDKQYWLAIHVASDPEMTPRQRIAASAYAMRAETADNGVPRGAIIMWSGRIADIPSGWALCDGTNGTPDLRDRFIVGARQDDGRAAKTNVTGSPTQSGGSVTISLANLPNHNHGLSGVSIGNAGVHTHTVDSGDYQDPPAGGTYFRLHSWGYINGQKETSSNGAHIHTISGSTDTAGSSVSYAPPYYALAFIMKL